MKQIPKHVLMWIQTQVSIWVERVKFLKNRKNMIIDLEFMLLQDKFMTDYYNTHVLFNEFSSKVCPENGMYHESVKFYQALYRNAQVHEIMTHTKLQEIKNTKWYKYKPTTKGNGVDDK